MNFSSVWIFFEIKVGSEMVGDGGYGVGGGGWPYDSMQWSYEHMFASSHAKLEMRIQLGSQVFCCVTALACHINLCLTMRDALTPRQPTQPPPPHLLPHDVLWLFDSEGSFGTQA